MDSSNYFNRILFPARHWADFSLFQLLRIHLVINQSMIITDFPKWLIAKVRQLRIAWYSLVISLWSNSWFFIVRSVQQYLKLVVIQFASLPWHLQQLLDQFANQHNLCLIKQLWIWIVSLCGSIKHRCLSLRSLSWLPSVRCQHQTAAPVIFHFNFSLMLAVLSTNHPNSWFKTTINLLLTTSINYAVVLSLVRSIICLYCMQV